MESVSHLLDYSDGMPVRSMSSREITTKTPPSNGQNFTMGQEIIINLPTANELGTFMDFANSGLELEITNNDGQAVSLPPRSGIFALLARCSATCAGSTLFDVRSYNQLVDAMRTIHSNADYDNNVGKLLYGTAGKKPNNALSIGLPAGNTAGQIQTAVNAGAIVPELDELSIANGESKTFFVPLIYTALYSATSYLPCFARSPIQLRIVLDDVGKAFKGNAGLTNADIAIRCEWRAKQVQLSNDAFQQVVSANQGRFDMVCEDYRITTDNIPVVSQNNSVEVVSNLGLSVSSLNALIFFYNHTANDQNVVKHKRCRITNGLSEVFVSLNGTKHPQRSIKLSPTNPAEAVAELLTAQGILDVDNQSRLNELDGAYVLQGSATSGDDLKTNYGSAVYAINMKNQRSKMGEGAGGSQSLISGVSTLGASLTLNQTFTAVGADTIASTLFVVGCYVNMLSLDLNGSQSFQSSS